MACKLFADGAAQVHSTVHTYAHLVCSPFASGLRTIRERFANRLRVVRARVYEALLFPTPGIRIEFVPTFPFLHRISCMKESLLSSSCAAYTADWYAWFPASIVQYFLFSLLTNWIYVSVTPSRHSWLVPYLLQNLHSVWFVFSIQFLIFYLNLPATVFHWYNVFRIVMSIFSKNQYRNDKIYFFNYIDIISIFLKYTYLGNLSVVTSILTKNN